MSGCAKPEYPSTHRTSLFKRTSMTNIHCNCHIEKNARYVINASARGQFAPPRSPAAAPSNVLSLPIVQTAQDAERCVHITMKRMRSLWRYLGLVAYDEDSQSDHEDYAGASQTPEIHVRTAFALSFPRRFPLPACSFCWVRTSQQERGLTSK